MFTGSESSTTKTKVAIYTRVSTQEQEVEGFSLEAQNKKLKEYVTNNPGLNLETCDDWIFSDTDTGSIIERKNLTRLRALIAQKQVQAVLVWKIDRLSRNLQHLLILFDEFEKAGVSLISLQENINFAGPIGKLVFQMFGAIAQFERELIKDRTKVGRLASAEAGNYTGATIPFGYKALPNPNGKGKKLEIVAHQKLWVKKIFDMYIHEHLGFGEIATKLNKLKVPIGEGASRKRKTGVWTNRIVGTLIANRIYTGEYIANKTRHDGAILPLDQWMIVHIPPCIDRLTYCLAEEIRESKSFGNNKKYLLAGKLRDITYGKPRGMSGVKRSKGGYSYRRKPFTENGLRYSVLEIPMKQVDDHVWNKLYLALKNPRKFVGEYLARLKNNSESIDVLQGEASRLEQEIAQTELALDRIQTSYFDKGAISETEFNRLQRDREEKLLELRQQLEETVSRMSINNFAQKEIDNLELIAKAIPGDLQTLTATQKKILVDLFVERVEVLQKEVADQSYKREIHLYYRFNPKKWLTWTPMGCTEESISDNKRRPSDSQKDENGATCRT